MSLVTLDFETYYNKDYSLSKMTMEAYIRDPRFEVILFAWKIDNGPTKWATGTHNDIKKQLDELELHKHMVLCHNTKFDASILNWHFDIRPKFLLDTMLMARPRIVELGSMSLASLAKYFNLGVKGGYVVNAMGMLRRGFTGTELGRYGEYCCTDVELTHKLLGKVKLPNRELRLIDLILRMYTQPLIELDDELLTKYHAETVAEKNSMLERLCREVPDLFVDALAESWAENDGAQIHEAVKKQLMSNPKLADLLERLGVDPPRKISVTTEKETYAFAKSDPEFVALADHENPLVRAVVTTRLGVKSTIEETRALSFLEIARRGPLPVPYQYYAAHTGRLGGSDKINLQNMRRGGTLRKTLRPPKGYIFVVGDSSQIEARETAWFCEQADLVSDFAAGVDIYSKFATRVFGYEVDRNKKEIGPDGKEFLPFFDEGFVGKTCILGLGFGTGADKLQKTLRNGPRPILYDVVRCTEIVGIYRHGYRNIPRMWYALDETLGKKGERFFGPGGIVKMTHDRVTLPNGMAIMYNDLYREGEELTYKAERGRAKIYGAKCLENIVQALACITVFDQMLDISTRHRVVMSSHDEIVLCVPESQADEAQRDLRQIMSTAPAWAPGLPIACKVYTGYTYGDAK